MENTKIYKTPLVPNSQRCLDRSEKDSQGDEYNFFDAIWSSYSKIASKSRHVFEKNLIAKP